MRVGTSNFNQLLYLSFQDHPHACGDKFTDRQTAKNYL